MVARLLRKMLPDRYAKKIRERRLHRRLSKPVKLWGQFVSGGYSYAYTTVERYGVPEVNVAEFIADNIWGGDICVDIGAHFGFYTLLMSLYAGKEGYVYAFEPDDSVCGILKKNIRLNNLQHVKVCHEVVGQQTGNVTWIDSTSSQSHVAFNPTSTGVSKNSICLDDWFQDKPLPDFLKIDVEGYEYEVLSGALRVLAQARPKMIIEIHLSVIQKNGLYKIWHLLNSLGYEMYSWRLQIGPGHSISKYKLPSPEAFLGGHIAAIPIDR